MEERIFNLKKGTEVADRFDGLTIPFQVPSNLPDMVRLAGGDEEQQEAANEVAEDVQRRIVNIFNQAWALYVQKYVKADALNKEATVDTLRARPTQVKMPEGDRARKGTGTARKAKPVETQKASILDLLIAQNPELLEKAKALGMDVSALTAPAEAAK